MTYCTLYSHVADAIDDLDGPLIAAVNGATVAGGFELMCLADIRIAADDAVMFTGDTEHGLPTTSGLSWLLPRLLGVGRAYWMAYLGRHITAQEALKIGLVDEVHPTVDLLDAALAAATEIASKPGAGIAFTRRLIRDSLDQTRQETVKAELEAQRIAWSDPDVKAAMNAFLASRK
jgi:enoyl-CoA hydratase/carnithine racemase